MCLHVQEDPDSAVAIPRADEFFAVRNRRAFAVSLAVDRSSTQKGLTMNLLIVALDTAIPATVPDAEVLVVAPAVNSWLRRWASDEDAARRRASARAATFV